MTGPVLHRPETFACTPAKGGQLCARASDLGAGPRVFLVERTDQPETCLRGLLRYAETVAAAPQAHWFRTPKAMIEWLRQQPVKLDEGFGRQEQGCSPAQRSEVWPEFGLNCWEATAHFVGAAIAHRWDLDLFVFDAPVNGQRHVFPAWRKLGSQNPPEPLVLQPPVRTGKSQAGLQHALAQAEWYEELLGGLHFVGDKVLRVFGAGGAADELAKLEDDALPDWARTPEQRAAQAKRRAERAKQQAEKRAAAAAEPPPGSPRPGAPSGGPAPQAAPAPQTTDPSARLDITALVDQINQLARENAALRQKLQPGA